MTIGAALTSLSVAGVGTAQADNGASVPRPRFGERGRTQRAAPPARDPSLVTVETSLDTVESRAEPVEVRAQPVEVHPAVVTTG